MTKRRQKPQRDPHAIRLDWLERKHAKAEADSQFANGYRAGLYCALLAIRDGRDLLDYSIDEGKADIR